MYIDGFSFSESVGLSLAPLSRITSIVMSAFGE